jgi:hypothetical protein
MDKRTRANGNGERLDILEICKKRKVFKFLYFKKVLAKSEIAT